MSSLPYEPTRLFLFDGLSRERIEELLSDAEPRIAVFKKGDTVLDSSVGREQLGFVLEGRCRVLCCRSGAEDIPLNIIGPYESFGILSVLTDEEYPTSVRAVADTRVLFFSKESVLRMIRQDTEISLRLLRFLAGRVEYLNRKIRILTGKDMLTKLASLLLESAQSRGADRFPLVAKHAADALGCGRASLYRSLDVLSERGIVSYEDHTVTILKKHELERITQ